MLKKDSWVSQDEGKSHGRVALGMDMHEVWRLAPGVHSTVPGPWPQGTGSANGARSGYKKLLLYYVGAEGRQYAGGEWGTQARRVRTQIRGFGCQTLRLS